MHRGVRRSVASSNRRRQESDSDRLSHTGSFDLAIKLDLDSVVVFENLDTSNLQVNCPSYVTTSKRVAPDAQT